MSDVVISNMTQAKLEARVSEHRTRFEDSLRSGGAEPRVKVRDGWRVIVGVMDWEVGGRSENICKSSSFSHFPSRLEVRSHAWWEWVKVVPTVGIELSNLIVELCLAEFPWPDYDPETHGFRTASDGVLRRSRLWPSSVYGEIWVDSRKYVGSLQVHPWAIVSNTGEHLGVSS